MFEFAFQNKPTEIEAERKLTGVSDPIAAYWISRILAKAKELSDAAKRDPTNEAIPRSEEEIAAHLRDWLDTQPGDHMNPLLNWSGTSHLPHRVDDH